MTRHMSVLWFVLGSPLLRSMEKFLCVLCECHCRMSVEVSICVGVSGSLTCKVSLCLSRSAPPSPPPPSVYTCTRAHTHLLEDCTHILSVEKNPRKHLQYAREKPREKGKEGTCCERRPPGLQRAPPPEVPRAGSGGSAAGLPESGTSVTPRGADQSRPRLQDILKTAPTQQEKHG